MENATGSVEVDLSRIPPPPPDAASTPATDIATLVASIDWARGMIRMVILLCGGNRYITSNLTSIANGLDPDLNPKLKPVFERHQNHGT